MGIKFNPLLYSGFDFTGQGAVPLYKAPVDTELDLPTPGSDGEARYVRATEHLYIYDAAAGEWVDLGLVEAAVGTTPNPNGYDLETPLQSGIRRNTVVLQPADVSNPGVITTGSQEFSGTKDFVDELVVSYVTPSLPLKVDASGSVLSAAIDLSGVETTGQLSAVRIGVGDVDNTELSQLNGITSNVQTQLDNRLLKSDGDINETLFLAANNVSSQLPVTGLSFLSTVRSFECILDIQLDATISAYEFVKLIGVNKNGSWLLYSQSFGDVSGVDFYITAAGQVEYTSANSAGFNSMEFKFRALTLND